MQSFRSTAAFLCAIVASTPLSVQTLAQSAIPSQPVIDGAAPSSPRAPFQPELAALHGMPGSLPQRVNTAASQNTVTRVAQRVATPGQQRRRSGGSSGRIALPRSSAATSLPQALPPNGPSSKFVLRQTVAEEELNLHVGLPHILTLRQAPLRTYVPQSGSDLVAIRYIDPDSPHRLAIEPLSTGTTTLTMWFASPDSPDGEEPVSWLVNVSDPAVADLPETIARNQVLEQRLEALQRELNFAFPNSSVQLSWVGTQVLLRGKARDVEQATQIARIVSASVPGRRGGREEDFLQQAEFLFVDQQAVNEAGSLPGAIRGDNGSGVNSGRINNNVINMLEISGVHQVMLKVTVAEVNRSAARTIGADLQIGTVGDAVRFFTNLGTGTAGGSLVLDQSDFDLTLTALKNLNLARSLAEPTLTTLNGQPANFNVGGSFPIPVVTGQTATGLQGVQFQNFGVQLQFTPIVTDGDRVRLTLQASVSTRDEAASAQVGNTNVPGLNTRDFSNTVELREGQTLAVAGLIQNNLGGTSTRVPLAGDIPGIGRLFSNDNTSYDEQELVVLVTPYLVAPVDTQNHPLPIPGSDYFEPDDVEFFLHGSLTGHLAEDYRSPVRTDLAKMKAYRRCVQRLIIGQPGHSNGLLCPAANVPSQGPPLALPANSDWEEIGRPQPIAPPGMTLRESQRSVPDQDPAGHVSLTKGGVK